MKRIKIFSTLAISVLTLAVLVFGVWAAVNVNFSLQANISFNPEGVYVDISGQVYRGEDYSSLEPLTIDSSYTLNKLSNYYTAESGEVSGNFSMSPWTPSEVQFTPYQPFVQYEITIKNNSLEPISVIPTNISGIPNNVEVKEESSATLFIEPNDQKSYRLNLELLDTENTISAKISINFDIKKVSEIPASEDWMQITEMDGLKILTGVQNTSNLTDTLVLRIPETVNGMVSLEYMESPDTINLNEINLFAGMPESVKYIIVPDNFMISTLSYANSKFQGIGLPNSVTLSPMAFAYSSLVSLDIPDDLTTGSYEDLFVYSDVLRVDASNFDVIPNAIFEYALNLEKVDFSDNLISIGDSSFVATNVSRLDLPITTRSIGSLAFSGCLNLKDINILGGADIQDNTFENCRIESINYQYEDDLLSFKNGELTVKFISDTSVVLADIKKFQFLTKILVIEEGYTKLGDFSDEIDNMYFLQSLVLPESLTTIDSSFNNCPNLENVFIPKNLTSIGWTGSTTKFGEDVFMSCPKVKFTVDSENTAFSSDELGVVYNKTKSIIYKVPEFLQNYTLPSSVQIIAEYAFNNSDITSFELTTNITSIEERALGFKNLQNITIPSTLAPTVFLPTSFTGSTLDVTTLEMYLKSNLNVNYVYSGTGYTFNNGELIITAETAVPAELENISRLIQKVTMPDTITNYNDVFCYSDLSEINYSRTGTGYSYENGVFTINVDTTESTTNAVSIRDFSGSTGLIKTVKFAPNVTKFNLKVFPAGFSTINKIELSSNLTEITGNFLIGALAIEIEMLSDAEIAISSFAGLLTFPLIFTTENNYIINELNNFNMQSLNNEYYSMVLIGMSICNTKIYVNQKLTSSIFEEQDSDKSGYYLYKPNSNIVEMILSNI